jgi:hypothetical protein
MVSMKIMVNVLFCIRFILLTARKRLYFEKDMQLSQRIMYPHIANEHLYNMFVQYIRVVAKSNWI